MYLKQGVELLTGFMRFKIGDLVSDCFRTRYRAFGIYRRRVFLDFLATVNLSCKFLLCGINSEKRSKLITSTHISVHFVKFVTASGTGMKDYAAVFSGSFKFETVQVTQGPSWIPEL
jgi:hypothetical protein